ncbi:MAG: hypothetical protein LBJ99_04610 [Oscillospiraceae bacterium]|jgi:hypothetical protein|nr:hypothetical protein [Oscillospiraceae bacterium]
MAEFEDKLNEILSSPEQMGKIMEMARSFSGGSAQTASPAAGAEEGGNVGAATGADALDPRLFGMLTRVMGAYSTAGGDDKSALLGAISPYLDNSRRAYMEQAVQMVKFTRLARAAISEFSENE